MQYCAMRDEATVYLWHLINGGFTGAIPASPLRQSKRMSCCILSTYIDFFKNRCEIKEKQMPQMQEQISGTNADHIKGARYQI